MRQPPGRRAPAEPRRAPEAGGQVLLPLARAATAARFGHSLRRPSARWLAEPGASFVTLTIAGRLRGCIGSLTAHRSLGDDIEANAVAAAFRGCEVESTGERDGWGLLVLARPLVLPHSPGHLG